MSHTTASPRLPLLIIEDEAPIMALVRATLERNGYQVVCCNSAAEGLNRLAQEEFLGIVSDMRTPGEFNGADVYNWVSKNRPTLASRILFITGDLANEKTLTALRKTGAPCVEKPFRVRQFLDVVQKTMGKPQ